MRAPEGSDARSRPAQKCQLTKLVLKTRGAAFALTNTKTQPRDARELRRTVNTPLSNISLRRGRAQRSSCVTAHEASKRDRRPADLGVLRHVCLATAEADAAEARLSRCNRRRRAAYC